MVMSITTANIVITAMIVSSLTVVRLSEINNSRK
jgi:hypothetical protein